MNRVNCHTENFLRQLKVLDPVTTEIDSEFHYELQSSFKFPKGTIKSVEQLGLRNSKF